MVRPPLTRVEHARGERLGTLLREARGTRSMAEIAAASGVPAETLRKIETGRIATPAFFTVAALADALGLSLGDIARQCSPSAARPRWRPGRYLPEPAAERTRAGAGVARGEAEVRAFTPFRFARILQ